MCLTNQGYKPNIYFVKTMVCKLLYVNDGNDKNPRSHSRSHDKALKYKNINKPCERVNNFSRAYVGNYFFTLSFLYFLLNIITFIFFISRARMFFLFTCSHLIRKKYKNKYLPCERIKNLIHMSFTWFTWI